MGACGCSDSVSTHRVRGAHGWIGVGVYPGCDYCDSPAGVDLWKLDDEWDEPDQLKPVKLTKRCPSVGFAVIHAEELAAAIKEVIGEEIEVQEAWNIIRSAVHATEQRFSKPDAA